MWDEFFFGNFKTKLSISNIKVIDDIYSDSDMVLFYNSLTKVDNYNDLNFYEDILSKSDNILEIGSGSGRFFNKFSRQGYNVYGLEPSKEMIKSIDPDYSHRIFNIDAQNLDKVITKDYQINKTLIPATTISLFSKEEAYLMIETLFKVMTNKGKLIFDILNPKHLESIVGEVNHTKIDGNKYFTGNFYDEAKEKFYFNIYLKSNDKKKLGYSTKYVHTFQSLEKIASKLNLQITIRYEDEQCVMLEMYR